MAYESTELKPYVMDILTAPWRYGGHRIRYWRELYYRASRIQRIGQSRADRIHERILYRTQKQNKMLHPEIITGSLVAALTAVAVIVWTLRQAEFCEGWKAIWRKVKEARAAQYDPEDITECIRMYWRIVGDIADAPGMDELQSLTLDMEVFRRKFVDKVPDGLYDSKMLSLIQIYDRHWRSFNHK